MKTAPGPLLFFIAVLYVSTSVCIAQDTGRKISLKLYSNFQYSSTERTGVQDYVFQATVTEKDQIIESMYFSPSISFFTPSGNNHEIELTRLRFNRNNYETIIEQNGSLQPGTMVEGGINTDFLLALRYEYNMLLLKKRDNTLLSPSIGFSATPFLSVTDDKYKISLTYPKRETRLGFSAAVIPRMIYTIGERWFLDLNIPISLVDVYYNRVRTNNPTLTQDQRTTSTMEIQELPSRFQVRLGVGLRL